MRKNLLFLCTFLCVLGFFAACSDDKNAPEPPAVEQIVGEYSADKLKVEVDGKVVSDAKIDVVKEANNTISVKLYNVVPGVGEYTMTNVTYGAVTRSDYVSTLKGSVEDNVIGYVVSIDGVVDNKVLTASVTTKAIKGEPVNPESFIGVRFKGVMNIAIVGGGEPVPVEQVVYISKTATEDPNTFCLNIKDFSFDGMSLGDITLDSVAVVKRGDVYGFNAEGCKLKLNGNLPMEVVLDVRGAIVNNNTMAMNLSIDADVLKVNVAFEGKEFWGFAMDKWSTTAGVDPADNAYSYQEPLYMATSNYAAVFLALAGFTSDPYFVSNDNVENAAKIITRDTEGKSMVGIVIPKSTAGTLFIGNFDLNPNQTLKSTKFGIPCHQKPTVLKVSYKYIPGPVFYKTEITGTGWDTEVEGVEVPGKVDECSVAAYLYEVDSYDEYLDGTNINAPASRVILKAALENGGKQENFVEKELKFIETGKGSYDPAKKYKLAIVCTSSKEGDAYKGAPESALWIKHLEVVTE